MGHNNNEEKDDFNEDCGYALDDWEFYKSLRDEKLKTNPTRLALHSGDKNKYFNTGEDGKSGGDGLHILGPTPELINAANECVDENENFKDPAAVLDEIVNAQLGLNR